MEEQVVLVNNADEILGLADKMEAHQKGLLHRAFSVFLFNDRGDFLLQQRASNKYHSPLLWTNTCCSHPRINETYLQAAQRRLQEEMGITKTELTPVFDFIYRADVGQGLIEHELDHVFVGQCQDGFNVNPQEVQSYRWVDKATLEREIQTNPTQFTQWFLIIFNQYINHLSHGNGL